VSQAVEAALPAMERKQFDTALAELQAALGQRPTSPNAPQARLMIARIYDRQNRVDAALAAYSDLRATYPKDPASADALLRMADLVQQTKQSDRTKVARSYLDQIVANFPATNVAPRALACPAGRRRWDRRPAPSAAAPSRAAARSSPGLVRARRRPSVSARLATA